MKKLSESNCAALRSGYSRPDCGFRTCDRRRRKACGLRKPSAISASSSRRASLEAAGCRLQPMSSHRRVRLVFGATHRSCLRRDSTAELDCARADSKRDHTRDADLRCEPLCVEELLAGDLPRVLARDFLRASTGCLTSDLNWAGFQVICVQCIRICSKNTRVNSAIQAYFLL
jgi:hypothetical protein